MPVDTHARSRDASSKFATENLSEAVPIEAPAPARTSGEIRRVPHARAMRADIPRAPGILRKLSCRPDHPHRLMRDRVPVQKLCDYTRRACASIKCLMPLDSELATFEKLKADLLVNHAGKFALIKGDAFKGAFDTPENAYSEGVALYGREPFLVKRIAEEEEVYRNQAFMLGLTNARI